MPNKYFRYITSCVILLARIEGFAKSSTFPNDSIARPRREIDTKYLAFPQGSNVQVRSTRILSLSARIIAVWWKNYSKWRGESRAITYFRVKFAAFSSSSIAISQLVYCLTMSTYSKPRGVFTVVVTAALAWELPYRNTVPYGERAEVYHRRSRRELYRKVELMLKTWVEEADKDGKMNARSAISFPFFTVNLFY